MKKKKNIPVVPHPGGWAIKREGGKRASKVGNTKDPILQQARAQAKREKVELVIHKGNGTIMDKDSYGKDTSPPKDRKY